VTPNFQSQNFTPNQPASIYPALNYIAPLPALPKTQTHPPPRYYPRGVKPTMSEKTTEITLLLRRRTLAPEPETMERHLTHAELIEHHGADHNDIHSIEAFASEHHFLISKIHVGARSVTLTGPFSKLAAVFGAPHLPDSLKEICRRNPRP